MVIDQTIGQQKKLVQQYFHSAESRPAAWEDLGQRWVLWPQVQIWRVGAGQPPPPPRRGSRMLAGVCQARPGFYHGKYHDVCCLLNLVMLLQSVWHTDIAAVEEALTPWQQPENCWIFVASSLGHLETILWWNLSTTRHLETGSNYHLARLWRPTILLPDDLCTLLSVTYSAYVLLLDGFVIFLYVSHFLPNTVPKVVFSS